MTSWLTGHRPSRGGRQHPPVYWLLVLVVTVACGGSGPTMIEDLSDVHALAFDGVDDVAVVPDAPELDISDRLTLSAWYRHDGQPTADAGIIQKDGPASVGSYGLWVSGDSVVFCVKLAGVGQQCVESGPRLVVDRWHHVSGVYDGSRLRLLIDGMVEASADGTGTILPSDLPLYIGADLSEAAFLRGALHEVCVWNIARPQSMIMMQMDMRMTGTEPGLVGLWHMDEGMGSTTADATASGLSATLGSTAAVDAGDPEWITTTWPHR